MIIVREDVFEQMGESLKGWLKNPLNQTFFAWYFLPALGFVLTHLMLVMPALGWGIHSSAGAIALPQPAPPPDSLEALLVWGLTLLTQNAIPFILIPLGLGLLLGSLSTFIVKMFEGLLPFERAWLAPWLARNRERHARIYGELEQKRRAYFLLTVRGLQAIPADGGEQFVETPEPARSEQAAQLAHEIQALHERNEEAGMEGELPVSLHRVTPTALGNALAVAEEYPFERYGVDAVLFWPRLRMALEPEKLDALDVAFGVMTGLLNVALLAGVLAVEAVALGTYQLVTQPPLKLEWVCMALASALIGWLAYRAAVSTARAVGNLLKTFFDYYRARVLEQFHLTPPAALDAERVLWLKLAAFLRRGEPFYFPAN